MLPPEHIRAARGSTTVRAHVFSTKRDRGRAELRCRVALIASTWLPEALMVYHFVEILRHLNASVSEAQSHLHRADELALVYPFVSFCVHISVSPCVFVNQLALFHVVLRLC